MFPTMPGQKVGKAITISDNSVMLLAMYEEDDAYG
jgi:hypothetical protein